ncbi:MAG: ribosomal RNA adenine dimethylase domain-containing protein [Verrucomicrobiota bacterium]
MSERKHFFRAFLRDAGKVGAIAPSSQELGRLMLDWMDWDSIDCVVEFGAGTGVFTELVPQYLKPGAAFFTIERDPVLAGITRSRCPEVTLHETCVSQVAALCHKEGVEQVDAIICGLPWASFSSELQEEFLGAMFGVLPTGGQFATFAYWQGLLLPAGQRFRRFLKEHFRTVEQSPTAWRNLPPAFVYRCER